MSPRRFVKFFWKFFDRRSRKLIPLIEIPSSSPPSSVAHVTSTFFAPIPPAARSRRRLPGDISFSGARPSLLPPCARANHEATAARPAQFVRLERLTTIPASAIRRCWRCSGRWCRNLSTSIPASRLTSAVVLSSTFAGARADTSSPVSRRFTTGST